MLLYGSVIIVNFLFQIIFVVLAMFQIVLQMHVPQINCDQINILSTPLDANSSVVMFYMYNKSNKDCSKKKSMLNDIEKYLVVPTVGLHFKYSKKRF